MERPRKQQATAESDEGQQEDTSIFINDDPSLDFGDRVRGAHAAVDDLINRGSHILHDLTEQDETMKRIQRRMLDIGQRLGLSQTVMKMIEQRSTQDMYIMVAGMIVSTVVMILVYIYYG